MKLELCCVKDTRLPAMEFVLITPEVMVATNAYILVVVPSVALFADNLASIPPEGILVHHRAFKALRTCKAFLFDEGRIIGTNAKGVQHLIPFVLNGSVATGFFPKYEAVIPTKEMRTAELNQIRFNPKLLWDLAQAMGCEWVKLTFSAAKSIFVEPADLENKAYGVIMSLATYK